MAVLQMEPGSDRQDLGRGREERSHKAQRCDEYRIHVPAEAWNMVPQQTFVVTLTCLDTSTGGQIRLQLNTIGGDELDVQLPKDSAVEALMQTVAEQRQLGPGARVCILNPDGELLEPLSMLWS